MMLIIGKDWSMTEYNGTEWEKNLVSFIMKIYILANFTSHFQRRLNKAMLIYILFY